MKNNILEKIFFLGLHISVPLGLLLAFLYAQLKKSIGGLFGTNMYFKLDGDDWKIMIVLFFVVVLLIFIANLKRKYIDREQDFSPFKLRTGMERSPDKNKAIYHGIPSKFCSPIPDGLTLGKQGKNFVRIPFEDSPEHQFILGPSGSNKSTSLLNAMIYNQNFRDNKQEGYLSALVVDCKPELSKKSVDESRSDIKIINPTTSDSVWGFDCWFGLDMNSTDDEIKKRAEIISRSLIPDLSSDNAHFSGNAQKLLSGFLMYGFRKGMSFAESITNVLHLNIQDYISQIITDLEMQNHPKIIGKVKSFEGNTSDEFASIVDTLEKDLNIFDTDSVQHCFDSNPKKATPYDLENGISLFLAIPDDEMTMYSKVFGLIIELCVKHLSSIKEETLTNRRPVWFLIDEGGTIFIPSIVDVLSRGRSKKIQISLICQSYSQLEDLYSPKAAESILDNCKTTIVFGTKNERTCRALSALTGYYRETKRSVHSTDSVLSLQDATNISQEYRPVMDVADISELEGKKEVLVFTKEGWFVTKKLPYYEIPEFKKTSDRLYRKNVGQIQGDYQSDYHSRNTFEDLL